MGDAWWEGPLREDVGQDRGAKPQTPALAGQVRRGEARAWVETGKEAEGERQQARAGGLWGEECSLARGWLLRSRSASSGHQPEQGQGGRPWSSTERRAYAIGFRRGGESLVKKQRQPVESVSPLTHSSTRWQESPTARMCRAREAEEDR